MTNVDRTITAEWPCRLPSLTNQRHGHWGARHRQAKKQRQVACSEIRAAIGRRPAPSFPLVVTITRIAPRRLDDDNVRGAAKSVRDGIAAALQVDDADPRVEWRYQQERGAPKECAVRVEICEASPIGPAEDQAAAPAAPIRDACCDCNQQPADCKSGRCSACQREHSLAVMRNSQKRRRAAMDPNDRRARDRAYQRKRRRNMDAAERRARDRAYQRRYRAKRQRSNPAEQSHRVGRDGATNDS